MVKSRQKKKTTSISDGDPWFNPHRNSASDSAKVAFGQAIYDFEHKENRKRARKKKDRQWLWKVGYALLADLAYRYLNGSPGKGLVIPRAKSTLGKRSRYHPPFFTQTFPKLLDALEDAGYLHQNIGSFSGVPGMSRRTTIRAGSQLIELIKKHEITFADLGAAADEVIVLKRAKSGYWDEGGRVEYDDTATTRRLRAALEEINSWLEDADVSFDSNAYNQPVDVRARRLYRYFANANFKSGGFPKGVNVYFPPKTKIGDVIAGIRERHPMLKSVLATGIGFRLMYLESEIMMRVLENLLNHSIVGLPIFDGVIVKASAAEATTAVMREQFKKATSLEIQVRLERCNLE